MGKTAFYFDEWCLWHSTGLHAGILELGGFVQPPSSAGHAESPETKRRLKNLMDVSGLTRELEVVSAAPITKDDALLVHTPAYLEHFKEVSDRGGGMMGDNAPIGPGSYEIALLSAGLAYGAVSSVLEGRYHNAYALTRPPSHHCLPDQSMGFCFLHNIAIAIEKAKRENGLKRVAVLDWDVHHGNGTQAIFEDRDDVLTISIHQQGCFPPGYSGENDRGKGKGKGANINIPLFAGAGHEQWVDALREIALPAIEAFKPDIIIVASGYDANAYDPLARMQLHSQSFRELTTLTKELAEKICSGRLVLVHEGGYSEFYVPFCGHAAIEALSGIKTKVVDPVLDFVKAQQPTGEFADAHRKHLDYLKQLFSAPA